MIIRDDVSVEDFGPQPQTKMVEDGPKDVMFMFIFCSSFQNLHRLWMEPPQSDTGSRTAPFLARCYISQGGSEQSESPAANFLTTRFFGR